MVIVGTSYLNYRKRSHTKILGKMPMTTTTHMMQKQKYSVENNRIFRKFRSYVRFWTVGLVWSRQKFTFSIIRYLPVKGEWMCAAMMAVLSCVRLFVPAKIDCTYWVQNMIFCTFKILLVYFCNFVSILKDNSFEFSVMMYEKCKCSHLEKYSRRRR